VIKAAMSNPNRLLSQKLYHHRNHGRNLVGDTGDVYPPLF